MKKIVVLATILALPAGLCVAQVPAASPSPGPGLGPAGNGCSSPVSTPATLKAGGLMGAELAAVPASDLPQCPATYTCGGYNVVCQATNCHTTDLGYSACVVSGNTVVACTDGQTVHVTNCGCQEIFRARCCDQFPACICAGCNSGSQSVSCQ